MNRRPNRARRGARAHAVLHHFLAAGLAGAEVRRSYIVQLADKPAGSDLGGVAGMAATKPGVGQLLNAAAPNVQSYLGYLAQPQAAVLAAVAGAPSPTTTNSPSTASPPC